MSCFSPTRLCRLIFGGAVFETRHAFGVHGGSLFSRSNIRFLGICSHGAKELSSMISDVETEFTRVRHALRTPDTLRRGSGRSSSTASFCTSFRLIGVITVSPTTSSRSTTRREIAVPFCPWNIGMRTTSPLIVFVIRIQLPALSRPWVPLRSFPVFSTDYRSNGWCGPESSSCGTVCGRRTLLVYQHYHPNTYGSAVT